MKEQTKEANLTRVCGIASKKPYRANRQLLARSDIWQHRMPLSDLSWWHASAKSQHGQVVLLLIQLWKPQATLRIMQNRSCLFPLFCSFTQIYSFSPECDVGS